MEKTIHNWVWHLYDRGFSLTNYVQSYYDISMHVWEHSPIHFFTEKEREIHNVKECIDMVRFIALSELEAVTND